MDGLPLDFLQGRVPKLLADGYEPVSWPADPGQEWAPPGHGEVFAALAASGLLAKLLERGYEYVFLSELGQPGAVLEPRILGWFTAEGLPFASEVVDRTEGDKKGGHLARRRSDGRHQHLRETAQVPEADQAAFEDVSVHRYFNCNNVWLNLRALERALTERDGVLELSMIVNRKTVDPRDSSSPEVLQLETAMGAAIGVFDGAGAVHSPRGRAVPVKKTNDLLVVRSGRLPARRRLDARAGPEPRGRAATGGLDSDHYKLLGDFEERFPPARPRSPPASGSRSRAMCASAAT